MGGNAALADVNSSIGKELTQVVIRSPVTEPKFEHLSVQSLDKIRRKIKTSALRLQPTDEAVKSAHDRSGGDPGGFTQALHLGERIAQLIVRRFEPVRQLLHDRHRHIRKFPDHAHEWLL